MVKRTYDLPEEEPEQSKFDVPSAKEHLFQVTDLFTNQDDIGIKLGLDDNTVSVKCEVVGGEEAGRTLLNRCNLDKNEKAFFFTRMFLKAIGESYKGAALNIDTDRWIGRQFYATVIHNGKYANIDQYNFDKKIDQEWVESDKVTDPKDIKIAWDE